MSAATTEARTNTIALQVIDSDESQEPRADGKPSTYQGRHRGADRLRQLASAGWALAVVAVLLAGGGTALFWASGMDEERPSVDGGKIADLCELVVDAELLAPWADSEQARNPADRSEEKVRTFDCTYSAEYAGDEAYRLVTVFATVQVYEDPSKARAAYAGVLEFEASEGHETSSAKGVGEQAAVATIAEGEETEVRLHAQEANATISLNVFFTGTAPKDGDVGRLTEDLGAGLVDALPRAGK
ncbi:hypothetical protein [Glycomyces paridis]|uniref:DUF3558 domain-containing protein n=1 Tax=Glycomyces paridis TaxID=2126555 RepID=A0A4S8NWL6_9ACTN|nr:hypothetical protein [Glycomyces paridis]THV22030.1 hypothetical protein E9998_23710 [Glycomyces paridis]